VTALLVMAGAAVGAPLRFLIARRLDARLPWGTLLVNVAGSFLLGLLSALSLGENTLALLGTGLCGGFTTYSAFAVQTEQRGLRLGATYAVLTIGLALGACALGFLVDQA
jgi:CrcB protein